jgi:hypothetical protein
MYFNNTDKIVLALQYDLYTDQNNTNQIGWLITLYKMGPVQVMLLYTSYLPPLHSDYMLNTGLFYNKIECYTHTVKIGNENEIFSKRMVPI